MKLLSSPKKLKVAPKPKAARPQKMLPQPDLALPTIRSPGTPDKLTRACAAAGQHSFTTPVPPPSGPKRATQPSRARSVQPTILADRFRDADAAAAVISNDKCGSEEHRLSVPRALGALRGERSRARGRSKPGCAGASGDRLETDGAALTSDDNISMTGLVDSPSDSCSDDGARMHGLVSPSNSLETSGGSGSEDSDSSAAHRRQAHKFITVAHMLAAPAMQARSDSPEEAEQRCIKETSAQPVMTDAEGDECSQEDASDSDESEASLGSPLGIASGSRLPSLSLSESKERSARTTTKPEDKAVVRALSEAIHLHKTPIWETSFHLEVCA